MFLAALSGRAQGHNVDRSHAMVTARPESLSVVFAIDAELVTAVYDLGVQTVKREQLLEVAPLVDEFVARSFAAQLDGEEVEWTRRAYSAKQSRRNLYLNLSYTSLLAAPPTELHFQVDLTEKFGSGHKVMARFRVPGKFTQRAMLTEKAPDRTYTVGRKVSAWELAVDFPRLGGEHILLGCDHIAMLLALLLGGGAFLRLLGTVSSFAAAHTITLVLAGLGVLDLPGPWIEAGIALGIAAAAVQNFWLCRADTRWIAAAFLGLVHGFSLAESLRQGELPTSGLLASLLAVNVGVALAGVAVAAVLLPATLWLARRPFRQRVVWIGSTVILLLGLGWFVERVAGLSFMPI